MPKTDYWPTIHAERKALASDLSAISEEKWSTPTLCDQWTVRDLLAHLTATGLITPASFFPKFVAAGFSFERVQAKGVEANRGSSPADTLARFEGIVDSKKSPPGPKETMLGEVLIHSEDIRRPLGIKHEYPVDAVTAVAQFYTGSNVIIGAKKRIEGLTLQAIDTEWSHGSGPEVSGPILSLMMAITGRKAALEDLSGPGVATLSSRP